MEVEPGRVWLAVVAAVAPEENICMNIAAGFIIGFVGTAAADEAGETAD